RTDAQHSFLRRVLPYRTADRRIDGVVIAWVDITDRLAAEGESRRLNVVLRDSNDAVLLLDLQGRVVAWNHGAERLYGYTEAEVRNRQIWDFVPKEHQEAVTERLDRVRGGTVASESAELVRLTKDGRLRDVSVTMTLLR